MAPVRRAGGGRRLVCENDPGLVPALKLLVEPATLGDPMRPLIWVSKSMEKLAATLTEMGHPISADTVRTELMNLGFSRQSNRKADEGSKHPDRNAQFEYINAKAIAAQAQQQPVISVDTKKKELIGNFKNGGTDYRPKGDRRRVNVHDFEDKKLGTVVPYGVLPCNYGSERYRGRSLAALVKRQEAAKTTRQASAIGVGIGGGPRDMLIQQFDILQVLASWQAHPYRDCNAARPIRRGPIPRDGHHFLTGYIHQDIISCVCAERFHVP
jgi:hypothetical protein